MFWGFPGGAVVKNPPTNAGDTNVDPCVRKIPWTRKWQQTPVFLHRKSYGQRSLVGCSPWDEKSWQIRSFKTVTQEPTDLIFHGHTNSKYTHKTVPSQRNPEISWVTLTHLEEEKQLIKTGRRGGDIVSSQTPPHPGTVTQDQKE